jgi:hypothetical protein
MPAPIQRYPYKPLDSGGRAIRVLKLLSADDFSSEIECQIEHVDLDEDPFYEALSYTWGDANDRKEIQIDGHRVSVTANLEVALRYLRHKHHVGPFRVLWADALCINQDDLTEKAAQIRMMYEIYASAAAVMAWTGEASDDVDKAFEAAMALNKAFKACGRKVSGGGLPSIGMLLKTAEFRFEEYDWDPLWRFLQRPYFTRVWIVQELHAAAKGAQERGKAGAVICCGATGLRAKVLQMVCLWFASETPVSADVAGRVHMLERIRAIHRRDALLAKLLADNLRTLDRYRKEDGSVLPGINMLLASIPKVKELHPQMLTLALASKFAATEPRDKVYALLGLFGEEYKDFPIDYSEDVETVYQTLTYAMITKEQSLRVLSGNRSHPSWQRMQASWTLNPCQVSIDLPGGFPEDKLYRAGGAQPPVTAWDKQAKTLTVRGLRLTSLETVTGPFRRGLHSVLTLAKTIFPALNTHTYADLFEKAWKTALRVADGLRYEEFGVTDFFAKDTPGYQAVASRLWATPPLLPLPAVVEEFHPLLSDNSRAANAAADEAITIMLASALADHLTRLPPDDDNSSNSNNGSGGGGGGGAGGFAVKEATSRKFLARLAKSLEDRCFCVAESGGYYVLGPYGSRPGDVVAVFVGEKKPYILREKKDGLFELVGDVFVSGVMAGELFESGELGGLTLEMLTLV